VIVILMIIAVSVSGSNKNTPTADTTSSSSTKTSSNIPTLNQQANDGKLGFTITSLQCNVSQIEQPDNSFEVSTAGAPYCEMNLSIKGIGSVSQTFDSDSQYIYSSTGTQYAVDDDATIDANSTSNECMLDPTVNPGVTITCTLAFDVPANVTPTYAMLHDSQLSNGVRVNLQ